MVEDQSSPASKITTPPPLPQYPNLRPAAPWRKGQSGNPKGRPKGRRNKLTLAIQSAAAELAASWPAELSGGKEVARVLWGNRVYREQLAARLLAGAVERLEGLLLQYGFGKVEEDDGRDRPLLQVILSAPCPHCGATDPLGPAVLDAEFSLGDQDPRPEPDPPQALPAPVVKRPVAPPPAVDLSVYRVEVPTGRAQAQGGPS